RIKTTTHSAPRPPPPPPPPSPPRHAAAAAARPRRVRPAVAAGAGALREAGPPPAGRALRRLPRPGQGARRPPPRLAGLLPQGRRQRPRRRARRPRQEPPRPRRPPPDRAEDAAQGAARPPGRRRPHRLAPRRRRLARSTR